MTLVIISLGDGIIHGFMCNCMYVYAFMFTYLGLCLEVRPCWASQ